jgi:hypothetical protein
VILTMYKLIGSPYKRGGYNHTNMHVGCIKMHLGSSKMLVHFRLGIVILVTLLGVLRPR